MNLVTPGRHRFRLGGFVVSVLLALPSAADLPMTGGDTTVHSTGVNAFSLPAANLSFEQRLDFSVGNSFFRNPWIPAPATTTARDGLGPLFNTNACQSCHIKDGRGHLPESDADNAVSMLVRLSIPADDSVAEDWIARHGVIPEPTYGGQFQDASIPGTQPEGRVTIEFTDHKHHLLDGSEVMLRRPAPVFTQLSAGDMHPDTRVSVRLAPAMIGLGLLEAVAEEEVLAWADPDDANGDGVSGRANRVWDVQSQSQALGRFGWKAGQPTLRQQNAAAFNGDLGLTSELFRSENCSPRQPICAQSVNGGDPEVRTELLDAVTFYSGHLAVPAQRNHDRPEVQRGEALFSDTGCAACHRPTMTTGTLPDRPALSNQTFHPFTDLLLHDMGPGLADNRAEFVASGTEWRTPPLWGIGLVPTVNGHQQLLHDGRASSVFEAILWHDGEARASREAFETLSEEQRAALIEFVNSL
ncbi:thiol oxidoreductase [Saccharospirillum sp. MSK14-1]|uniref:di-heme oxidoreductase family protein n=1 Tax=Saccharospirillum sp. MSK14-1 TaxID=1897632 RepID=UPI000D37E7AE|nr:di-heme oxidoredictase family protein [Saccharospirillum sp. MSK14-1]PTY36229.1 thiol oxidoreductase [Saccharospirillum sp. MSK14-1]